MSTRGQIERERVCEGGREERERKERKRENSVRKERKESWKIQ